MSDVQLIDSHCHLDRLELTPYGGNLDLALDAARAAGICRFFNISIGTENVAAVVEIAERYSDVYASVGIHPNEDDGEVVDSATLVEWANHPKVLAIGETGLDYFRSEGDLDWQRQRFRDHIAAAKQTGKPLVVHSREARVDTLKILREEGADQVGGIMHCFVEDQATAEAAMEMGFYISFSGIVSFKNAEDLRAVARTVPADRLLVETDSPYLAPVPFRGKPNQPLYVLEVAKCLAELREVPLEQLAEQTTANFYTLFPESR